MSGFNAEAIKQDFPILDQIVNDEPLVYLDNAATTQKPMQVLAAIEDYYLRDNANVHRGVHTLAERATAAYEAALAKAQKLTDKSNQEEVASVVASMKFATDNHLLTNRMIKYFADYLDQLKAETPTPTPEPKPETPTSSKGDQVAPVVETPEFTGGVNGGESAIHEVPEYTEPIGTAGDEVAVKEVPEFTGSVNAVESAVHEVPEYTGVIGTAGDQVAPTVDKPTEDVRILSDKATGVVVAGLSRDLTKDMHLQVQKVRDQSLQGMEFDAYALHLVDKDNHKVQPKGAVLVRLPVSGEVAGVYYTASGEAVNFTNGQGTIEFTTSQLGHYAVVYKQVSKQESPSTEEPVAKAQTSSTEEARGEVQTSSTEEVGGKAQTPSTDQFNQKQQDPAVQAFEYQSVDGSKPGMKIEEAKEEMKAKLPETGTSQSDKLFFLASLSLAMSALFLEKRKED